MKKIAEDLYQYKGVIVRKSSLGNYIAHFYVSNTVGWCTVTGATQASFKRIFNQFVAENGGLDKPRTNEFNRRNFKEVM